MSERSTAAQALVSYIDDQIDAILIGDGALRHGDDPIHDTRVAIRRLRSTLRIFHTTFNPVAARRLDTDLAWLAALLGDVRDVQVQRHRMHAALDDLAPELVLGPVRARIDHALNDLEYPARRRIDEEMQTPRYHDMLTTIRAWRAKPPIAEHIDVKTLRRRARRAAQKADRRLHAAVTGGDAEVLHRARKAAKRARYAIEMVADCAPVSRRTIKRYKKIQSVLGDHHDATVAAALLRRLGASAGNTTGENGFTYGLLYAQQEQEAQRCRDTAANIH